MDKNLVLIDKFNYYHFMLQAKAVAGMLSANVGEHFLKASVLLNEHKQERDKRIRV